ncbi:23S rRNA (uracil(1939)-C(5))-methyltransferase RlmD [candidate division KSB1 bacterium]|nr:23S rRNA (uracil(1939)-C(5))-methyltransferase RlmD [candidate division KSB1 bacterium]
MQAKFKRNEIVEATIESLAFGGSGVAHIDGFTILIKGVLPLQKVEAQITRNKKNYAEARLTKILFHSPFEVTPRCEYFGTCGGCRLQNMIYEEQLNQKQRQVKETLIHIGGFSDIEMEEILPSPETFFYRNKMEYSFSDQRWLTNKEIQSSQIIKNNYALGLHIPGRYDKVLDINQCFLLSERSNEILNFVRSFTRDSGMRLYASKGHTGFYRFLVFREAKTTGQFMVNLVTAENHEGEKLTVELAGSLKETFPFITTFVHNVNRKKAQIAFGETERIIFGPGYIEEKFGDKIYRISTNSFFQTNSLGAEKMFQLIKEWGAFDKRQVVYDLYGGTGSIGIFISDAVKKIVGIELVPQAIEDAKTNCLINDINNCEFIQGDLLKVLRDAGGFVKQYETPDVVIIDPPRSGMHPKLPEKIIQLNPTKIIYVSCNPATLARDLKVLCESAFRIKRVQPIDMFPHTAHCETVVLLER